MRRFVSPIFLLGLLALVACGKVTTSDPDAASGDPDAPEGSDGALPIDAPGIDAPPPASCGDGIVNGTDTCDDGANNGVYGYCAYDCTGPGLRCGDGTQNGPEACDSGANNGMYGYCNATCSALGPRCGDGALNGPEVCDSGANNGTYGNCNTTCTALGPRCGDGTVNGPESCDSGANNGQYNQCNTTCSGPGPRCGDQIVQSANGEQCDAGTVYSQSMAAGVCRPDCQGPVLQRTIGVTARTLQRGGVGGIDGLCQTTFGSSYRALVTDGVTRRATVTPNRGDGQVGWVLLPYTRYVSAESGLVVFITDSSRLLGASGGVDQALTNPIRPADDGYGGFIGAEADWTSSYDCNDWTNATSAALGTGPNLGPLGTGPGTFPNNGGTSQCQYDRRFVCVQQ